MQRVVVRCLVGVLLLTAGCQRLGIARAGRSGGVPKLPAAVPIAEAAPASAATTPTTTPAAPQATPGTPQPPRTTTPPAVKPHGAAPGTPSGTQPVTTPPAQVKPAGPPPLPPAVGKEIVVAWEASLLYLLKDGKLAHKPLVINGAQRQYFRDAFVGNFKISEKMREKRSNLYDIHGDPLPDKTQAAENGAVMRNWMRIGPLAVGLHYSPAFRFQYSPSRRHRSHGCYRMSRRDSNMVFKWASVGTPVHVVRSLAGSKYEALVSLTPQELITGREPTRTASSRRSRRTRSVRRPAVSRTRTAARPAPAKPKPTAAKPAAPKPASGGALDSGADTPSTPPTPPAGGGEAPQRGGEAPAPQPDTP